MSEDPDERFDFAQVVEDRFSPLLRRGFTAVSRSPTLVRYESSKVSVRIFMLELEHSVDLDVARLTNPKNRISLYGILALAGEPLPGPTGLTTAAVAELAKRLLRYGGRALAGDASEYDRAMEQDRRYTAPFLRHTEAAKGEEPESR